ncbi:hypothetical protein JOM56_013901 [Amanita muscaria]
MESLLTPSESHAFQSFLSSLDVSAPEWAHYTTGNPNPDDIIVDVPVPHAHGREALTKATKELMALDTDRWNLSSADSVTCRRQQLPTPYDYQHRQIGDQQQHPQRQTSIPLDSFPYMNPPKHPSFHRLQPAPVPDPSFSSSHHLRPLIVPSSVRTNGNGAHSNGSSTSATTSTSTTPTGTTPVYPVSPGRQPTSNVSESLSSQPPSSRSKKQNGQGPSNASSQKATLLSPSQKKANHIQSEQKRRANIRRGYDALCDTVPALREAIIEEEEKEAEARANGKSNGRNGSSKRSGKKRDNDFIDKADGRAGPRSENIVLSKTIEYINDLLSERQVLLNRMHRTRAALPPGHPALIPPMEQPLWEREWKGGEGKYDVKNEGEEEEEEDDETS